MTVAYISVVYGFVDLHFRLGHGAGVLVNLQRKYACDSTKLCFHLASQCTPRKSHQCRAWMQSQTRFGCQDVWIPNCLTQVTYACNSNHTNHYFASMYRCTEGGVIVGLGGVLLTRGGGDGATASCVTNEIRDRQSDMQSCGVIPWSRMTVHPCMHG